MEYVKDRELFSNPYIIQMDRFAESLKHLSETFLYLEDYKGSFTKDEIEEMFLASVGACLYELRKAELVSV